MIFMLKRHHANGKKNKLKQEVDRTCNMMKSQIELQLKHSNRKSENDFIDLDQLKPDFALKLTDDIKMMAGHFKKQVHTYVK